MSRQPIDRSMSPTLHSILPIEARTDSGIDRTEAALNPDLSVTSNCDCSLNPCTFCFFKSHLLAHRVRRRVQTL